MKLTQEQKRIKIAEACGWYSYIDADIKRRWKNRITGSDNDEAPDYFNDLNAMHEAEKTLDDTDLWRMTSILAHVVNPDKPIAHATAAQRAEAFGRVKGLWK